MTSTRTPGRKHGILTTTKRLLNEMLKDRFSLPKDVSVYFVSDDPATDKINIILKSEEFEMVPEGAVPPYLNLEAAWDSEENYGSKDS
jgi:hypothetical protein